MYIISENMFLDFNMKNSVIDMYSLDHQSIQIEYCIFHNLTSSSSAHAGAIYLSFFNSKIVYNCFLICECLNTAENDAGNSIKIYEDSSNITHCLMDKCVEGKVSAESTVSVRSSNDLRISNSNFTNNVAQNSYGHWGSPSVECEARYAEYTSIKYSHIENGKGRRGIYFSRGNMFSTNIINFVGYTLLEEVKEVRDCCFFNNEVSVFKSPTDGINNCFTDDIRGNSSTMTFTQLIMINNANWERKNRCIDEMEKNKLMHRLVSLISIAFNYI